MDEAEDVRAALASVETEAGSSLLALAEATPVLLVFLRHFGCSFCRQAISDVADLKEELARRGVRPVLVHLGTPERAKPFFEYYGIGDVERVSDPVVWVGWLKGAFFRHGIGPIKEDADQMPGLFFLKDARIVRRFRYRTIADEPDYLGLVR